MDTSDPATPPCSNCGPWWRLPLMLALVLGAIVLGRIGLEETSVEPGDADKRSKQRIPIAAMDGKLVSLAIDVNDGQLRRFQPIEWREGMTVYDLLRESPREDAKLEVRGSGAMTFLSNLDGIANEGAGGRNWIYKVNGKHADRSFAIYELEPGDEVLWTFAPRQ